jgi:hypothetical protein
VPLEDVSVTLCSVQGRLVAVSTPLTLLKRIGFFAAGSDRERILFYPTMRSVRAAARTLGQEGFSGVHVMMGDISGLPLVRRSAGLVVCPFPAVRDPDLLRSLRRTAGVLDAGGMILLFGKVRRNPLGWMSHIGSVALKRDGGLPSEQDITSWVLHAGFNRIVRFQKGRGSPLTMLQATKSLP